MEMDGEIKAAQNAMPAGSLCVLRSGDDDMLTIYGSIAAPSNCESRQPGRRAFPSEKLFQYNDEFHTYVTVGNVPSATSFR